MSQIRNRSRSAVSGGGLSTQRLAAEAEAAFSSVDQLETRWGISGRHIRRYIASGELIATRFGRSVRISAAEVARFEASLTGVK